MQTEDLQRKAVVALLVAISAAFLGRLFPNAADGSALVDRVQGMLDFAVNSFVQTRLAKHFCAAVMACLSLLPAVGQAMVLGPIDPYAAGLAPRQAGSKIER